MRTARLRRFERLATKASTPPQPSQPSQSKVVDAKQGRVEHERSTQLSAEVERLKAELANERKARLAAESSTAQSQPKPEGDEDTELAAAIALSLQPADESSPTSTTDSFWSPPRYMPPTLSESQRTLSLIERAQVRDGGYEWQDATALLDTGNAHITLVDARFAARHAIYLPGQQAERYVTIRGVVPGATSQAPVVTIALKIRGQDLTVPAAISTLSNEDVLVDIGTINRLFSAGFRMGAGSA